MKCPFCMASINVSPDAIHQVGLKPDNLRRWIKNRRADPQPKCMYCLTPFVPGLPVGDPTPWPWGGVMYTETPMFTT